MATIREYFVNQLTIDDKEYATVENTDDGPTITRFSPIPTLEEVRAILGDNIEALILDGCFNPNSHVKALPKAPPADTILYCDNMYSGTSILVAPTLPKMKCEGVFGYCRSLLNPAVIPIENTYPVYMYSNCDVLQYPASIPHDAEGVTAMYWKCLSVAGELIARPESFEDSSEYRYFLRDTTNEIILYGDRSVCEALAATANNGNASWSPWYDPVPAVTDRGQGSYTTADDMTRMVRNGALAVDTYAPGRMVYHQGDIVREDEWNALVEAAQTIDPTITYSSHYANLNKIEAAFDSAL